MYSENDIQELAAAAKGELRKVIELADKLKEDLPYAKWHLKRATHILKDDIPMLLRNIKTAQSPRDAQNWFVVAEKEFGHATAIRVNIQQRYDTGSQMQEVRG